MMNRLATMIPILVLLVFGQSVYADDRDCMAIGGLALGEAMDETSMVAALGGDMTGASAIITGQRETANGLILDMEHHFISNRNGLLKTRDQAVLTSVVGKDQNFMLEIEYNVVESRGVYEGYRGVFRSYGLIKLDEGKVVLRYEGEICK